MKKIFVTTEPLENGNVWAMAISENGVVLAEVFSQSLFWAKFDLGFSSDKQHDIYKNFYPDGYELVYAQENSNGFKTATDLLVARLHNHAYMHAI